MNAAVAYDADVIIVGAGLAGGVLAGLLRRAGFSVALVEARAGTGASAEPDPRALAVTPASQRLLASLGIWPKLPVERIGVFGAMEVWDRATIRFDSRDLGEPALGYIVEAAVLEQALAAMLAADQQLQWYRPAVPAALDCQADVARLILEDGRSLRARLIVGADGQQSRSRTLAGISYLETPYPQQALACIVQTQQPHGEVARQRFLADGPLAFLPLADAHQCGIVWSTTSEQAQALLAMPDNEFCRALTTAFAECMGEVQHAGRRAVFPLLKAEAETYCKPRFVLIGDAAHSIHPLAGQGANLGWLDAASLAEVLAEASVPAAAGRQRDIGSLRVLRRYARWRRGENRLMQQALDGLHHLFLRRDPLTVGLRNAGLTFTEYCSPLKHCLMRHAMGRAGDLPKLLRVTGDS